MMEEVNNIDCRALSFSPGLSSSRLSKAKLIFGEKVLKRIVIYCLYILGAKRTGISQVVGVPENTVRTMLKTIARDGIVAFFDRRGKDMGMSGKPQDKPVQKRGVTINELPDRYQVSVNGTDIFVTKKNKGQLKSLLLTFAENGLISKTSVGKLLGISSSHVGYLINDISKNDLTCLIDKRQGQQKDYVFTPEIKSELIVQFAVNAATGKPTSSPVLTKDIEKRTSHKLSERSVRFYINGLGLKGKATQLWELVGLKKTL
jgi:hypothetical protein